MNRRLSFLFFSLLFLSFTSLSYAQDYNLDGSVIPQPQYDIPTAVEAKPTFHGLFTGKNYKIQVGFENLPKESPSSIFLSENLINYGQIPPTDPVSRTNTISVSAPAAQGYSLQALENHSLKHNESNSFIPDTTCDNGICTDTIAQSWLGTLTYGFGYRCDSARLSATNYCLSGFSDTSFFKHFSTTPQTVANSSYKSDFQITYKVNISGSFAPQYYSNKITFIAAPNF